MSKLQTLWLHLAVAITAITGGVFAVMKYLMHSDDEFSVVNHPLQPHMLSAHVVIAPVLLFVLGWTFSNHMMPKLRFGDGSNRITGISALSLIAPMTLSAYLLQISTNDALRTVLAWIHGVTSAIFVVAYLVHLIRPKRANGRSAA